MSRPTDACETPYLKAILACDTPSLRCASTSGQCSDGMANGLTHFLFRRMASLLLSCTVPAYRCAGFVHSRLSQVWQMTADCGRSLFASLYASLCALCQRLFRLMRAYPYASLLPTQPKHCEASSGITLNRDSCSVAVYVGAANRAQLFEQNVYAGAPLITRTTFVFPQVGQVILVVFGTLCLRPLFPQSTEQKRRCGSPLNSFPQISHVCRMVSSFVSKYSQRDYSASTRMVG